MTNQQLQLILAALANLGTPMTGSIQLFGTITTPSGFLPCDGAAVSRTTYSALFAVCGVSFGAGNGTTTFNVPDLRSRLPLGVGAGPGLTVRALADQGGAEGVAVAQANLAPFALPVTDPGHKHDVPVEAATASLGGTLIVQGSATALSPGTVANGATTGVTGVTVASGGSSTPLATVPPFTALAYFVKT